MIEITYPMILDTIRTTGIIVGIIYYLSILRNQQKARMLEMVSQRAQQVHNFEYQKMVREVGTRIKDWSTPEEYYEKYNYRDTPDLDIGRAIIQYTLNNWGFLFREGIINEEFIERLYNPWHIINFWETFSPILLDERETMGVPEVFKDLEYLYNAMKKKYPHLSKETRFAFQNWME